MIGGAVLLLAAVLVYRRAVKLVRVARASGRPFEDLLTIVAAAIATGVSAQGMWQFAGDVLRFDGPLRVVLFAFIEVAIVTSAVRARRNMRENYSAGIDGVAVWALTCLTAVLSSMDAQSIPEAVFRLAAPLVAAWLWERGMAIERHRITGRSRIKWRFTLERAMVRLGLAEADERTTTEVAKQRYLHRVALATVQARELVEGGAAAKRVAAAHRRLRKALEQADEYTDLATNPATQRMLLNKATTMRGGAGLIVLPDITPWADLDHPAVAQDRPSKVDGVSLINAGLAKWSQDVLREPAELVAARGLDATTSATGLATIIPAPRRRIHMDPGSPWPVGRLVQFETWTRPEPRPVDDLFPLPPVVAEPVAGVDASTAGDRAVDATDPRPVGDRDKPTEQDRKRAIRFYIGRARKLNPPSKRTLADWSGFSETWAWGCIQDARQLMIKDGWVFDERGTPTPPPLVAETVATTADEPSLNGSAPARS